MKYLLCVRPNACQKADFQNALASEECKQERERERERNTGRGRDRDKDYIFSCL
jgi:hypothetical protein